MAKRSPGATALAKLVIRADCCFSFRLNGGIHERAPITYSSIKRMPCRRRTSRKPFHLASFIVTAVGFLSVGSDTSARAPMVLISRSVALGIMPCSSILTPCNFSLNCLTTAFMPGNVNSSTSTVARCRYCYSSPAMKPAGHAGRWRWQCTGVD